MEIVKGLQRKIGADADGIIGPNTINALATYFKVTKVQAVHFIAQCQHESGNWRYKKENLNYSPQALRKVFGKYFKTDHDANQYGRKPEMIANKVYANRMGNGDEASGDGWRYRGRGVIQLTGKNNYVAFSEYIGDPEVITNPDLVAEKYIFESAKFFFLVNDVFSLAKDLSEDSVKKVTRKINGGYNGLDHRLQLTAKYGSMI